MRTFDLTQKLAPECAGVDVVRQPTARSNSTTENAKSPTCPEDCFSYTTLNGNVATVTTCTQVHNYMFNSNQFARVDYPATWSAGRPWPPQTIEDLCCVPDEEDWPCVGDRYLPAGICRDSLCKHTLNDWAIANEDWETYFELRETADRGIGVFARQAFKRLDILGWYAGDLTLYGVGTGVYALSLTIGKASFPRKMDASLRGFCLHCEPYNDHFEEEVCIEAHMRGNWTRFINHSCSPNTTFATRRVGQMRIMAVKAIKHIALGEEVTIHYGDTYFESRTCLCGAANCVETKKAAKKALVLVKEVKEADGVKSLESGMAYVQVEE